MLVLALRTFSKFEKGGAYDVAPEAAERWIEQDMVAPLEDMAYGETWSGCTVAVLASGPSLTKADVERVRKWRAQSDQHRVIAVNATYKLAPWADALMALDRDFWTNYQPNFNGAKLTQHAPTAIEFGCKMFFAGTKQLRKKCNSGLAAIDFAARNGAAKILLLGFDGQRGKDGQAHWHGDHPEGMLNATNIENWPAQAAKLASELPASLTVINCTKGSALTAWPHKALQGALNA